MQKVDTQTEDDQTEDEEPQNDLPGNNQNRDYENEGSEVPTLPSGGSQRDPSSVANLVKDDLQPSSPFSNGRNQYVVEMPAEGSQSEHRDSGDLQSVSSSKSVLTPYDPSLRLDVLTNKALLSMSKAWRDIMEYNGQKYCMEHPHFQKVMEELGKRGIVDENWTWTVDPERVDMT